MRQHGEFFGNLIRVIFIELIPEKSSAGCDGRQNYVNPAQRRVILCLVGAGHHFLPGETAGESLIWLFIHVRYSYRRQRSLMNGHSRYSINVDAHSTRDDPVG